MGEPEESTLTTRVRQGETIIQGQLVLAAAHAASLALGLGLTVLLLRRVDAVSFGAFVFAAALLQTSHAVVDAGLAPAVVVSLARTGSSRLLRRVTTLRVLIAMAATVVVVLASRAAFNLPAWVAAFLGGAVLLAPLRGFRDPFTAAALNRIPAGLGLAAQFIHVVFSAWMIEQRGPSAIPFVVASLCARWALPGVVLYFASRRLRIEGAESDADDRAIGIVAPLVVAAVCGTLYFHLDVFMLRVLDGPDAVGEFGVGLRALSPVLAGIGLLVAPLVPILARVASRPSLLAAATSNAVAVMFGAVAPLVVIFSLSRDLLGVVAPAYEAAAPIVTILGFAILPVIFGSVASHALIAAGRARHWMAVSAGGLALDAIANALLIPPLGALGAAWATLATEVFVGAAAVTLVLPRTGTMVPSSGARALLLFATCVGLGAASLGWLLPAGGSARLLVAGIFVSLAIAAFTIGPLGLRIRAELQAMPESSGDR